MKNNTVNEPARDFRVNQGRALVVNECLVFCFPLMCPEVEVGRNNLSHTFPIDLLQQGRNQGDDMGA